MSRYVSWVVPVILTLIGWGIGMLENAPNWSPFVLFALAGTLAAALVAAEITRGRRRGRTIPEAVGIDVERAGGMLATFLSKQQREGPPAEYVGETAGIRDPYEMRVVAYVRKVVPEYERDIKPQILKHYAEAQKLRFRDRTIERLLDENITSIQQLWEISDRLAKLGKKIRQHD